MHWKDCGKPTQTLYHVPTGLLQPTGNLVVLFEETSPPPGVERHLGGVALVAVHEHQ